MSDNIPTPSPLPSPPINPHSLSERINTSTRPVHTQLNRLILTRLPLALPPYTNNPSTYVSGLLHIAPIYSHFEGLWATILTTPQLPTTLQASYDVCDPEKPLVDSNTTPLHPKTTESPILHTPKICGRTHSLLAHLRLPGLLRAGRLRADIRILTSTPDHQIDAQLAEIARSGPLAEFLAHTKASVEANPHVLLAYAWVLYMALFSGGRYLRAALKEAGGQGNSFWDRDSAPVQPYRIGDSIIPPRAKSRMTPQSELGAASTQSPPSAHFPARLSKPVAGLQFFNFIGNQDGEDIKSEFKKRIAEAEVLLTSGEQDDIVIEAQHIFSYMIQLVNQLDAVVGTSDDDLETSASAARGRPLNASRDSVSVAKERISRHTIEREQDEQRDLGEEVMTAETSKDNNFLSVVAGPLAKVIEFRGRIPSFDDVVRKLSRTPTPQVTFVVEKDGGDDRAMDQPEVVVHESSRGTATPVLVLLLLALLLWMYTL
ncbi:heme-binding peroxidase [Diplocarpon rosae]|nr:heme-binding peroxidase [Diplocarpon rosae]